MGWRANIATQVTWNCVIPYTCCRPRFPIPPISHSDPGLSVFISLFNYVCARPRRWAAAVELYAEIIILMWANLDSHLIANELGF